MTKMKSTLTATFLTLVLAVPALAGNIGTPGGTPPPPPPPPACEETSSPSSPAFGGMDTLGLSSPELIDILIAVLSLI
jgi:hypothetical protein